MLFGRYSLEEINARVQENPDLLIMRGLDAPGALEFYRTFNSPSIYLNEYYTVAYKYLFSTENSVQAEDRLRANQNIFNVTRIIRNALFNLNYNVSLNNFFADPDDLEEKRKIYIIIEKLSDRTFIKSLVPLRRDDKPEIHFMFYGERGPYIHNTLYINFSSSTMQPLQKWNNYLYPLFKTINNVFIKFLHDNSPLRPDMESIFNLRSAATFKPAPFRTRDIWNRLEQKMLENNDRMH